MLDDSETSQEFLSMLPMTLSMTRFYDREYAAGLGDKTLSQSGEAIDDFENGDITYYIVGNALAIFFDQADNSNQSGLIRMGKVTSDLNILIQIEGDQQVTVSLKEHPMEESGYDFSLFENVQITGINIENLS